MFFPAISNDDTTLLGVVGAFEKRILPAGIVVATINAAASQNKVA